MSFWDDLAAVANVAANVLVQTFVPGAPPLPPIIPTGQPQSNPNGVVAAPSVNDRLIVLDLIDCLQKPPPIITPQYVLLVQRVASWLGQDAVGSPTSAASRNAWEDSLFPEQNPGVASGPTLTGTDLTSQESIRNLVNKARNDVLGVSNQCMLVVPIAANLGILPPANPFNLAMTFNAARLGFSPVRIDDVSVASIASNMRAYLDVIKKTLGDVALQQTSNDAAQLSSATLSLEGFGGSGNTSVDLGRLTPDQEAIKAQKALDALSVLDFTKRVPQVLFTAYYQPSVDPQGIIVGWKKVPDASGYVVVRRSIFDDKEVTYSLSNDDVARDTARLSDYVRAWILSFYDQVQPTQVVTFLDTSFIPDAYYYYTVQAYQLQNTNPGGIFTVETSPTVFSAAQKNQISSQLGILTAPTLSTPFGNIGGGQLTPQIEVSSYPMLSNALFGTPDYDWLLAALNTRASINRGDARSVTKQYSYLGAQVQFLFAQADAGKFVVPKGRDFSAVDKNITDAIAKFGMNQVIQTLLQETGAIYHFDGSEPNDDSLFTSVSDTDPDESGLLLTVASAIDPETATLDLKTLTSNMPSLLAGAVVLPASKTKKQAPKKVQGAKSTEIQVPGDVDGAPEINPTSEIENLQTLANTGKAVDLTTVDGLGTLMRVIRIFSDAGANRGSPSAQQGKAPAAVIVLPPPPGPNPAQPTVAGDLKNAANAVVQGTQNVAQDLSQGNVGKAASDTANAVGQAVNDVGQAIGQAASDVGKAAEQGAKDVAGFFGIKL